MNQNSYQNEFFFLIKSDTKMYFMRYDVVQIVLGSTGVSQMPLLYRSLQNGWINIINTVINSDCLDKSVNNQGGLQVHH